MEKYIVSANSKNDGVIDLKLMFDIDSVYTNLDEALEGYTNVVNLIEESEGLALNISSIWEQRPMYNVIKAERIECVSGNDISISLVSIEEVCTKKEMRYVVLFDKVAKTDDFIFLFEVGVSLMSGSDARYGLFDKMVRRMIKDGVDADNAQLNECLDELAAKGIANLGDRYVLSTEDIKGYMK